MKKIAILSLVLAGSLFAAMPDAYKKCVACHGANGQIASLGGKSKIIKDMTREDLISSMKGYKDGTYGREMKALMVAQVKSLSDADIEAIADYIVK